MAGAWQAVQAIGTGALPELVRLYTRVVATGADRDRQVFYNLGWRSEEAKRALMAEAHTTDPDLRLQVQWALGRVSESPAVVDVLLDNMQNDPVPLFRDKAACALAYDQVHLSARTEAAALRGPRPRARRREAAGETGGPPGLAASSRTRRRDSSATAPPQARSTAIEAWKRWLAEYRANL